jgi:5-methylcytosine-specific restriction enzyme subunit McrC
VPSARRRTCGAVVDAKYKAEKPSGFPDADLYQMLAYCTALALPAGYLVYAKGNEAGQTHAVKGAAVEIRARTLDLSRPPGELLAQVADLAAAIGSASANPEFPDSNEPRIAQLTR